MNDELLATIRERLATSTISDVMLGLGLGPHYLPASIRPLRPGIRMAGRAMPVAMAPGPAADFGKMIEALEALRKDDVYICAAPPGEFALWGELMSLRARHKQAAGAVVGGFHRDAHGCAAAELPLFSAGSYGLSSLDRAHVADFGCQIRFANGVIVRPGDVVVGDADGVVIVPAANLAEVVRGATEKEQRDALAADRIRNGHSIW